MLGSSAERVPPPSQGNEPEVDNGFSEDGSGDGVESSSVKVVVRVRPMVSHEILEGSRPCVFLEEAPKPQQLMILDKCFEFDSALSAEISQREVYEATARPLLEQFFKGYNATVLAYGQTGSGKTHTMGSTLSVSELQDDCGVIPRLLKDIFRQVSKPQDESKGKKMYRLQLSYLEIYNEDVKDLLRLQDDKEVAPLSIREDNRGNMVISGLSAHEVKDMEAVSKLLYRGALCRSTASTNMNHHSSRSHAICTLYLETWDESAGVDEPRIASKFHLVDLAGSERAKRSGAEGDRLKEGISINRGLLALGNVISALTDPLKKNKSGGPSHVPYRDSKITRLLQDSLGGNSYTVMIACVSPADSNMDETINTLRYAQRARKIQNVAQQNLVSQRQDQSAEIGVLKKEVKLLQMQLMQAKAGVHSHQHDKEDAMEVAFMKDENKRLRERCKSLEKEVLQATEEAAMGSFKLDCMKMRVDQLNALLKEQNIEVPIGLVGESSIDKGSSSEDLDGKLLQSSSSFGTEDDLVFRSEDLELPMDLDVSVVAELDMLALQIKKKEEAIKSMSHEDKCMTQLRTFFEGTIDRLHDEVKILQGERDQLSDALCKVKELDLDTKKVSLMRARERELEKKIKELQSREASHRQVLQLKAKAELQTKKLQVEVEEAKRRQAELLRKVRQDNQKLCKEKRTKELEAVRLKRNESRMKYELEKTKETWQRQEAVLRRKLEQSAAFNQRLEDQLKKFVKGSRAKEGGDAGYKQQMRQRELRQYVTKELQTCQAYLSSKTTLKHYLDKRAEAAQELNLLHSEGPLDVAEGDSADPIRQEKEEALVKEIDDLSSVIQECQKGLLDMESKGLSNSLLAMAGPKDKELGDQDMEGAEESTFCPITNLRRWCNIKTLGEGRQVLSFLFETALGTLDHLPAPTSAPARKVHDGKDKMAHDQEEGSLSDHLKPKAPPNVGNRIRKPTVFRKKSAGGNGGKVDMAKSESVDLTKEESDVRDEREESVRYSDTEEEEEEKDFEEEDDDSDYDPMNSPSRKRAGKKKTRVSKKLSKIRASLGKMKGTSSRIPGKGDNRAKKKDGAAEERQSLEDEIDAILSDRSDKGPQRMDPAFHDPSLPLSHFGPVNKLTVPQIKCLLKARGQTISGKKDVLIERLKQYSPGAGVDTTSGIEDPVAQGKSQSCSEVKGDGNRPPLTELSNQLPRRLIRPKPATSAGLSSGAVRIPILSQIDDALDDL